MQSRHGFKKPGRVAASSSAASATNIWTQRRFSVAKAPCSMEAGSPQSVLRLFTLPNPMQLRLTKSPQERPGSVAQRRSRSTSIPV